MVSVICLGFHQSSKEHDLQRLQACICITFRLQVKTLQDDSSDTDVPEDAHLSRRALWHALALTRTDETSQQQMGEMQG